MSAMAQATQKVRGWQSVAPGLAGIAFRDDLCPDRPGAGELLVAVGAAGVNFSDILMLQDRYQVRPDRPFVPGQEVAGRVVEAGPGTAFKTGDLVAGEVETGGFSEYALLRDRAAVPIPNDYAMTDAAALPVAYGTAIVALTESTELEAGETVLVHAAAGGVGLAAVQVAKALGATVIATASTDAKQALALENGADHAIDYGREAWAEEVRTLTDGRGVDLVVDTVGGAVTRASLGCLARGGRLLVIGFASGEIPQIPANRLLLKRASAIGVYWNQDLDRALWQRAKARMAELVDAGAIRPVVDARHGLRDLPLALADLAERRSRGKLVLTVGAEEGGS